ncbi:carboxymuconolactone decarboxylase family protein [Arthrobacter roseus]|uniref:carboxymuconolactone decarboxylase family protein n=1 Tax=Arthrobacter roseus TaxID=136274 RepID=UPI001EF7ECDB|nr:carboxymuconolactone decarboxylase family protein [Arthrobacter roseus]MBM7849771.1 alkylhydroperoxidase family enzyme [Arthrobacter roseus]
MSNPILRTGNQPPQTSDGDRFPPLSPSDLTESQQKVYAAVTAPPRGNGPFTVVDDDGVLAGPFNALLYAPNVGDAVQQLGAALRFGGTLTARLRELIICTVAAEMDSAYEWYAHSRVAATVGVSEHELSSIREGGSPEGLNEEERAALALTHELLADTTVSPAVHAAALEHHDHAGITEITVLTGYYRLLAGILAAGDISAP